jgi:SulP family sulfate permease
MLARYRLGAWLADIGLRGRQAELIVRSAPMLVMTLLIPLSAAMSFESAGVHLVGQISSGLPAFSAPNLSWGLIQELALPAFLIALIGFIESVSVGKTLGAKRRQRIDPDQELIGLGAANTASALSGGFPVTGGFSRSAVNFEAGGQTQMASVLASAGIALAAVLLTPALYFLPKAVLAATIVVAVISLIDFETITLARRYRTADFAAVVITIAVTLLAGVELGVLAGVGASVSLHLYHTSRPHFAVVGQVPESEHYRNVDRHDVVTDPHILSLRIDESLYFANAAYLEDMVFAQAALQKQLAHVILMCPAVNAIDLSALEALKEINTRLRENNVALHLSEVKGPVMDALQRSDFFNHLSGKIFLSHHGAVTTLRTRGTAGLART